MDFNSDEQRVLKQIFDLLKLDNGRTVSEEINNIDTAPYVVGFKPGPGQIRLAKPEWVAFVDKLKKLVE